MNSWEGESTQSAKVRVHVCAGCLDLSRHKTKKTCPRGSTYSRRRRKRQRRRKENTGRINQKLRRGTSGWHRG